jgi:hypothetical protein
MIEHAKPAAPFMLFLRGTRKSRPLAWALLNFFKRIISFALRLSALGGSRFQEASS